MPGLVRSRIVSLVVVLATVAATTAAAAPLSGRAADDALETLAADSLRAFIEGSYALLVGRDPDSLWAAGPDLAPVYGIESYREMTDISSAAFAETHRLEAETLRLLRDLPMESASAEDQLTFDAYEWLLEDRLASARYDYWFCIGPSSYGVHNRQLQLFSVLPVRDLEDARDYVARLSTMGAWMDQLIAGLELREAAGYVPTRLMVQLAKDEITAGVLQEDAPNPDPRTTETYTTLSARLAELAGTSGAERAAVLADAEAAIRDVVFPAFRALRAHLARLEAVARDEVSLAGVPGGSDYYTYLLHHYVGTSATPDELHALGLREVARIGAELRDAAFADFGWPRDLPMADLSARIDATKTDRPEGDLLRAVYDRFLAEAQAKLPAFFGILPSVELDWLVDPLGPPACYQPAPLDGSGPGYFVVSLANPTLGTMYDEAALVYHETVPGHHLQSGVAVGLDLPSFQRQPLTPTCAQHPVFQAFTEGWALYAEEFPAEMGLYADNPVGNLWRLRLQLTQVVRLVADTGLNALGWTWTEAAAYLEETLGVRQRQNVLLRYESAPAQACGYAMGYATILDLRNQAQERLGVAFDIREFHDAVLSHGALPLALLERTVGAWVEAKAPH